MTTAANMRTPLPPTGKQLDKNIAAAAFWCTSIPNVAWPRRSSSEPMISGWLTTHATPVIDQTPTANTQCVGEWTLVGIQSGQREASMAGKDKGGRSSKTPASKSAKEKRQAKKEKKAGKSAGALGT